MNSLLWLIPAIPGVGAAINGLFGKRLGKRASGAIACGAVAASFALALGYFVTVFLAEGGSTARVEQSLFPWIPSMGVEWAYRLDSLSMLMTLVVTGIGLLIHIYSIGYMSHDEGFSRFFAYLNLFTFFMLNLVLGSNMLLMFIGWEGVGLCSYLLIGFWFERPAAAQAGKKAFVVNRIGDAGFILAVMLTFVTFGTLDFYEVMGAIPGEVSVGVLTAIGVLLFVGAAGKSAQIPLYVWLPDAMEGPTPVSALIHAATMVTAGVYMVARSGVLFSHAPAAMGLVAAVGAATALFAATIALFQNDIKKVLAYSTVSQLGYMFIGAGVGAFAAAIFHLMTHAFFKACLFLGSGSVIHAMEHAEHASGGHRHYTEMQDMRNMGGLKRYMPRTAWTFMVATAAIAGLPPLAGFFSKDEILWKATHGGHVTLLWTVGALAAALTAFYMTRQVLMTFWGDFRGGAAMESKLHESVPSMTLPLVALAAGSVVAGFVGVPAVLGGSNRIEHFLEPAIYAGGHPATEAAHGSHAVELMFIGVSVALALGGIWFAWRRYRNQPTRDAALAGNGVHRLLSNKYWVDEIYDATAVQGTLSAGKGFYRFDQRVVDGAVNGAARATVVSGDLSDLSDRNLVDRAVNLVAEILAAASGRFRRLQTGLFQNYALLMLFAVVLLAGALVLWS